MQVTTVVCSTFYIQPVWVRCEYGAHVVIAPVIIVTLYSIHDREETHGSITTTFFIATNYGSSLSGSFFNSVQNHSILWNIWPAVIIGRGTWCLLQLLSLRQILKGMGVGWVKYYRSPYFSRLAAYKVRLPGPKERTRCCITWWLHIRLHAVYTGKLEF